MNEIELIHDLIKKIELNVNRPICLMEFCGGHTVAILKNGIRQLLPSEVKLSSGPGCPVCVTSAADIDRILFLARQPGVIITTFGDLIRVPGSSSSLHQARAEGCDIRVVYSALESLDIARQNPGRKVIIIGIGFETTAPAIAASLIQAKAEGLANYLVYSLHKLTPPAARAILNAGELRLDGIICPGHVCTVTGSRVFEPIARDFKVACAVTGFEPSDILQGIEKLTAQIKNQDPKVEIAYTRAVRPEGNQTALRIMAEAFEVSTADWRGLGRVPESGLKLKPQFRDHDAGHFFDFSGINSSEPEGCLCGAVLRGTHLPPECSLFDVECTPEHPVGPCMVSSEGACAAYYLYGDRNG
jgi:hydrogenase expression/formation protein HypD